MTELRFVPVAFKCRCMKEEQTAMVRERTHAEDVLDWVEEARSAISIRHGQLSPWCRSQVMDYAKIPLPNDGGSIGQLTKLQS